MHFATPVLAALAAATSIGLAASTCFADEGALTAPAPYEVLRPGDRDMSCAQLAAEANGLNSVLLAQQKPHDNSGRKVAGAIGGGLLKGATHFGLSRVGGFGGMFARAASEQASDTAAQALADGGDQAAAAPIVTPEQQRMNHLLELYKEKSC